MLNTYHIKTYFNYNELDTHLISAHLRSLKFPKCYVKDDSGYFYYFDGYYINFAGNMYKYHVDAEDFHYYAPVMQKNRFPVISFSKKIYKLDKEKKEKVLGHPFGAFTIKHYENADWNFPVSSFHMSGYEVYGDFNDYSARQVEQLKKYDSYYKIMAAMPVLGLVHYNDLGFLFYCMRHKLDRILYSSKILRSYYPILAFHAANIGNKEYIKLFNENNDREVKIRYEGIYEEINNNHESDKLTSYYIRGDNPKEFKRLLEESESVCLNGLIFNEEFSTYFMEFYNLYYNKDIELFIPDSPEDFELAAKMLNNIAIKEYAEKFFNRGYYLPHLEEFYAEKLDMEGEDPLNVQDERLRNILYTKGKAETYSRKGAIEAYLKRL